MPFDIHIWLTLIDSSRSSLKVKVMGRSSRSHDDKNSFYGYGSTLKRDVFCVCLSSFFLLKWKV